MTQHIANDPAVRAARGVEQAEAALLALPVVDAFDELRPAFVLAEVEWEKADQVFADAVPSTREGVLLKLRALDSLLRAVPLEEDSLELRHLRSLFNYFEQPSASAVERSRAREAAASAGAGGGR